MVSLITSVVNNATTEPETVILNQMLAEPTAGRPIVVMASSTPEKNATIKTTLMTTVALAANLTVVMESNKEPKAATMVQPTAEHCQIDADPTVKDILAVTV